MGGPGTIILTMKIQDGSPLWAARWTLFLGWEAIFEIGSWTSNKSTAINLNNEGAELHLTLSEL